MRHVHPDLVGSARLQAAADETGSGEAFLQLIVGDCLPGSCGSTHSHFLPVGAGTLQSGGNRARPAFGRTPNKCEVFAFHAAIAAVGGELFGQALVGGIILGDHQETGCLLVDAVDDAGTLHPADTGQTIAAMGNQGVDEGASFIACTGVDHQPRRLVDDNEVGVLVDDGELDILRCGISGQGRWDRHDELFATLEPVATVDDRAAIHCDVTIRDQLLKAGAADCRKCRRQGAVKPVRIGDSVFEYCGWRIHRVSLRMPECLPIGKDSVLPSSIGQDGSLSRCKGGFDSRREHHQTITMSVFLRSIPAVIVAK